MDNLAIVKEAEANILHEIRFAYPGNLLDRAVYDFPEDIILKYNDDDQKFATERANKIFYRVKDVVFGNLDNINVYATISPYNSTAEAIGENMILLNPVKTKFLSDSELAIVLFHETGHLVGKHKELYDKLASLHEEVNLFIKEKEPLFNIALSRYLENEADKVSVYLTEKAGYDFRAYRKTLYKFLYPIEIDRNSFQTLSIHPSEIERIMNLDRIFNVNDLQFEDFNRRIRQIDKSSTIEEKMNIEAEWYAKITDGMYFTKQGIVERLSSVKNFSDRRTYQYKKALEYSLLKINPFDTRVPYRLCLTKKANSIRKILLKAKRDIAKDLTVLKKGKIVASSLLRKGKEQVDEWSR